MQWHYGIGYSLWSMQTLAYWAVNTSHSILDNIDDLNKRTGEFVTLVHLTVLRVKKCC